MKRALINSSAFVRASKKILKKKPELARDLKEALKHLEEDAYQPLLRTHKLIGAL